MGKKNRPGAGGTGPTRGVAGSVLELRPSSKIAELSKPVHGTAAARAPP